MNGKFIQIQSPIKANQDLIKYIKTNYDSNFKYIKKIGIQTKMNHFISINNQRFKIGKTGILELDNVRITSLFFLQDEQFSTLIDCIIE